MPWIQDPREGPRLALFQRVRNSSLQDEHAMCAPRAVSTSSSVARWIQAQRIEEQGGAWEERAAQRRRGGRDVSGNGCVDGMEGLRAGDGDRAEVAGECRSKGAKSQFAVVAGAECLAHDGGSGVWRPASRTQVLTWALGTGVV